MGDIIPDQSPQTIAIDLVLETKNTRDKLNTKPLSTSILTKLHAGYFRICLSLGGQALLWRTLSEHKDTTHNSLNGVSVKFPTTTFLLLWYVALFVLIILSFIYILRCIFHYHMVKAEFAHFVGVNYLFTPWTSWLLLLQSAPFLDPKSGLYQALWFIFVTPLLVLDVKIYGQWFTTEKRFLSTVANPTSQISVLGNLVAAWSAAEMGWKESATCFFTLGMTHYLVVFITLYQRLSGGDHLPVRLRPVYFLFVAAPSMASLAWSSISGSFDTPCRMLFFLSIFLFTSLACRPTLFKKAMKKFNIAWWAYSFPLTFLALSSVAYAQQVKGMAASGLMLIISIVSVLVFLCLMLSTALNIDMILRGNDPVLNFDYKAQ